MTEQIYSTISQFSQRFELSRRESTVLTELISGNVEAKQIANALGISHNTVRIHIKHINDKVGVRSKSAILSQFIRNM